MNKTLHGQRIYEYRDAEGNIYWSFHKMEHAVSTPVRLTLRSRLGLHVINFLSKLRKYSERLRSVESPTHSTNGGHDG